MEDLAMDGDCQLVTDQSDRRNLGCHDSDSVECRVL